MWQRIILGIMLRPMITRRMMIGAIGCIGAGLAVGPVQAGDKRISVLIVDGINNHDWPRATAILKSILVGSGHFTVDVSTSPPAGAEAALWERWRPEFSKYEVVLVNFNGGHTAKSTHWPREVEKAFEDYVAGGGGVVIYHSANNSFPNWAAYNEMIGMGWRDKGFGASLIVDKNEKVVLVPKGEGRGPGHGPEHDFLVTTLDGEHPITRGLPRKWMHPHEQLTHGQHGPARNVRVLTYAWSKDTRDNEVMDWVIPFGKGRVYTTMLGHLWKNGPESAIRCAGFATMLARGTEWAATGEVTIPVPADFPAADKTSVREAPPPAIKVTLKDSAAKLTITPHGDGAIIDIDKVRGISGADVERTGKTWPSLLIIRLHLGMLESLAIGGGDLQWHASVLSHSGFQRLITCRKKDDEIPHITKESPYWTEILAFDKAGKPVPGLPGGGHFELAIPRALLDEQTGRLVIGWIDAYRR